MDLYRIKAVSVVVLASPSTLISANVIAQTIADVKAHTNGVHIPNVLANAKKENNVRNARILMRILVSARRFHRFAEIKNSGIRNVLNANVKSGRNAMNASHLIKILANANDDYPILSILTKYLLMITKCNLSKSKCRREQNSHIFY